MRQETFVEFIIIRSDAARLQSSLLARIRLFSGCSRILKVIVLSEVEATEVIQMSVSLCQGLEHFPNYARRQETS
jgi:hypothetical protein